MDLPPSVANDQVAGVDLLRTPWAYEGVARDLILALKLRGRLPAAEPLAAVLARSIQTHGSAATTITHVPGRPVETRRRGFDHAAAIAHELGRLTGLPVRSMLRRTGDRPDQTSLSGADRRRNLEGAFMALEGAEKVILVDDLVTTGTTAAACAGSLRHAGVTYVELAAPCRA
jgi:predicted amidophosphoribosyltransferase